MIESQKLQVLLWDFDGVLVDSMEIRDDGFRRVLRDFPRTDVEALVAYHRENGGLSRYVKFRYFFEHILGTSVDELTIRSLASRFGEATRDLIVEEHPLIPESIAFIKEHHAEVPMHIVSGSDQDELRYICNKLGIDSYFISMRGSPTPKNELVREILEQYAYRAPAVALIGDSENDLEAAQTNGVAFWAFRNEKLRNSAHRYLDDFQTLALELLDVPGERHD